MKMTWSSYLLSSLLASVSSPIVRRKWRRERRRVEKHRVKKTPPSLPERRAPENEEKERKTELRGKEEKKKTRKPSGDSTLNRRQEESRHNDEVVHIGEKETKKVYTRTPVLRISHALTAPSFLNTCGVCTPQTGCMYSSNQVYVQLKAGVYTARIGWRQNKTKSRVNAVPNLLESHEETDSENVGLDRKEEEGKEKSDRERAELLCFLSIDAGQITKRKEKNTRRRKKEETGWREKPEGIDLNRFESQIDLLFTGSFLLQPLFSLTRCFFKFWQTGGEHPLSLHIECT